MLAFWGRIVETALSEDFAGIRKGVCMIVNSHAVPSYPLGCRVHQLFDSSRPTFKALVLSYPLSRWLSRMTSVTPCCCATGATPTRSTNVEVYHSRSRKHDDVSHLRLVDRLRTRRSG